MDFFTFKTIESCRKALTKVSQALEEIADVAQKDASDARIIASEWLDEADQKDSVSQEAAELAASIRNI